MRCGAGGLRAVCGMELSPGVQKVRAGMGAVPAPRSVPAALGPRSGCARGAVRCGAVRCGAVRCGAVRDGCRRAGGWLREGAAAVL